MKIPLFTPTEIPNAWHQVIAPGGYEWWHFDAEDSAGELRLVADFFQGLVFDPEYLRAYRRYRRRPTRCAPPLPAGYPSVSFALYRRDKITARFASRYPSDQFTAATDRLEIQIGPNAVRSAPDGSFEIDVRNSGISAKLKFVPRFRQMGRSIPPMASTFFPQQKWSVTEPLCDVSGEIILESGRLSFTGRGYHDHRFGTAPLGPGIERWMCGRVLMDDHALMFQYTQLSTGPAEMRLLEAEPLGFRDIPLDRMQVGFDHLQAGPLELTSPRVLDKSPKTVHLAYAATIRGTPAKAYCDIAYPNRRIHIPGALRASDVKMG